MRRLLALLLGLTLVVVPSAWAHGDVGVLELVESTAVDDAQVRYVVRLTYANDGDTESGTDVRISVDGGAPAAMTSNGDGLYAATVSLPGDGPHMVTFAVDDPEATLEVERPAAAQADPSTTTSTTTSVTTADDAPNVADAPLPDEDEDGGSTWLLVLMAIIVAVMVVVAAAYVRGRRPPE